MIRKFYVSMYQKGQLNRYGSDFKNKLNYIKTKNSKIQILEFEENEIKKYFDLKNDYEHFLNQLIGNVNLYRYRNKYREITNDDKLVEGYKLLDKNDLTKESVKAYYFKPLECWFAKSQMLEENGKTYVKTWLINKYLYC